MCPFGQGNPILGYRSGGHDIGFISILSSLSVCQLLVSMDAEYSGVWQRFRRKWAIWGVGQPSRSYCIFTHRVVSIIYDLCIIVKVSLFATAPAKELSLDPIQNQAICGDMAKFVSNRCHITSVLSLKFAYRSERRSRGFGRRSYARRRVWGRGCDVG